MIDNKKYLKDVSSMYSTAQRVKKYVVAELDKIDEKYRKIIAEEKKKLNEQLEVLNAQIKFYAGIVNPEDAPAEEKTEETPAEEPKEEVEEKIQDTIFPENNVEEKEETDEERHERFEKEDEEMAEELQEVIEEEEQELADAGPEVQKEFIESNTQEEGDPNQWPEYEEKQELASVEGMKEIPVMEETEWGDIEDWK